MTLVVSNIFKIDYEDMIKMWGSSLMKATEDEDLLTMTSGRTLALVLDAFIIHE